MTDLTSYEVESLRRSVAMLSPGTAGGLSREQALQVLDQLGRALDELDHQRPPGS